MKSTKDDRLYVEIELGSGNRKCFALVYPDAPEDIFVDTKGLPPIAMICACCDGATVIMAKVGQKNRLKRTFLPLKWVLEEWGCEDQELLKALQEFKKRVMSQMDQYREKIEKEQV